MFKKELNLVVFKKSFFIEQFLTSKWKSKPKEQGKRQRWVNSICMRPVGCTKSYKRHEGCVTVLQSTTEPFYTLRDIYGGQNVPHSGWVILVLQDEMLHFKGSMLAN